MVAQISPASFPAPAHAATDAVMNQKSGKYPHMYALFSDAWKALPSRFWAMKEYDLNFSQSMIDYAQSKDEVRRFQIERDLFGFFGNATSMFDSYFHAMLTIGSFVAPQDIQLSDTEATLDLIQNAFERTFPGDNILSIFSLVTKNKAYLELQHIRATLEYRIFQGRMMRVQCLEEPDAKDIRQYRFASLSNDTTSNRIVLYAQFLAMLCDGAEVFVRSRIHGISRDEGPLI